jgi:hypothetical protein
VIVLGLKSFQVISALHQVGADLVSLSGDRFRELLLFSQLAEKRLLLLLETFEVFLQLLVYFTFIL